MQNCSRANLLWFHPEGSIVYFTVCAPLDWPVSVTAPKLTFCDAPEVKASTACNPVAYADRGSKGTPLAHFFPLFLWASKEMGRGARNPANHCRRNLTPARGDGSCSRSLGCLNPGCGGAGESANNRPQSPGWYKAPRQTVPTSKSPRIQKEPKRTPPQSPGRPAQ